jgi:hypothetical protein
MPACSLVASSSALKFKLFEKIFFIDLLTDSKNTKRCGMKVEDKKVSKSSVNFHRDVKSSRNFLFFEFLRLEQ